jgi:hypothetical protein
LLFSPWSLSQSLDLAGLTLLSSITSQRFPKCMQAGRTSKKVEYDVGAVTEVVWWTVCTTVQGDIGKFRLLTGNGGERKKPER